MWSEWGLVGGLAPDGGCVETEARLVSLAAAASTRFAAAYDPRTSGGRGPLEDRLSIDVAVWECESSGGTEWVREETLAITDVPVPKAVHLRQADFLFPPQPRTPLECVLDGFIPPPTAATASLLALLASPCRRSLVSVS